jgi:hypothetical protein
VNTEVDKERLYAKPGDVIEVTWEDKDYLGKSFTVIEPPIGGLYLPGDAWFYDDIKQRPMYLGMNSYIVVERAKSQGNINGNTELYETDLREIRESLDEHYVIIKCPKCKLQHSQKLSQKCPWCRAGCAICGSFIPDLEVAIDAGWIPSFWVDKRETGPACPECVSEYLMAGDGGMIVLRDDRESLASDID